MCVHIQNLAGDTTAYRVPQRASVDDLKRLVSESIGVTPARRLRLILPSDNGAHTELADAQSLNAYGLTNDSTLHLFVGDLVPFDVHVECAAGSKGGGALQFDSPEGVCLHGDVLFVTDKGNRRVVFRATAHRVNSWDL